jgi:hypothetical protein
VARVEASLPPPLLDAIAYPNCVMYQNGSSGFRGLRDNLMGTRDGTRRVSL